MAGFSGFCRGFCSFFVVVLAPGIGPEKTAETVWRVLAITRDEHAWGTVVEETGREGGDKFLCPWDALGLVTREEREGMYGY